MIIFFFILYIHVSSLYSADNSADYRPSLGKQERKTLVKQNTGIYNIIRKLIIKDDASKYNEDWYNSDSLKKSKQSGDITDFTSDLNYVVKKHHFSFNNTPYNVQGVPIVFPSKGTGINLGVRLNLYNLEYRDPYKYSLSMQYWTSDRGRAKHKINLDVPHFFSSNWRIILSAFYNKNLTNQFTGIGNNSDLDFSLIDPQSSSSLGRNYYAYQSIEPGASIELRRRLYDKFSIFTGFDARRMDISLVTTTKNPASYLEEKKPYGYEGGVFNHAKFGFIYDSTNYPTNPERGNKALITFSHFLGDYSFTGLNLSWSTFYTPSTYLTIANRVMAQQFYGETPFFALSYFVSDDIYKGLGSEDTLRGAYGNRYIDLFKVVEQLEFRFNFFHDTIYSQLIKFDIVPFLDAGTVSSSYANVSSGDIHFSYGSSFRVVWNKNFLMNFSLGFAKNTFATYFSFGENF